jgi:peptidoglycan hydrolase-like protein with peptidoglycan-binding domain
MNRKRILVLFFVLGLMAIVAVVGWAAGSQIESPAEAAARTAPPTPSPILVPVEERVLSTNVVVRGTARFGLPQAISIAPSALKTNSAGNNVAGLITTLPSINTQFKEGDVLLTAGGRPVLILQGDIPAYRDMVPGVWGKDVMQLEQALARLGVDPGPPDGKYDERTSAAVAKWYEAAGYEPFGPTAEQRANIRLLETAVGDALKSRMAATSAAATAKLNVAAAEAKADLAQRTAAADISAKIAERALVVLDPRQLALARQAADEKLDVARAGRRAADIEARAIIQTAVEAQKVAEFDANLMATRADQAAADLEAAKRTLGNQVPVDEVVFLRELPVRVEQVVAAVGATASGPVMLVTDNKITIDSSLPLDAVALVKPGMAVDIEEQAVGIKAKGVVASVEKTPGTHGVDGYHVYFSVQVSETNTPLQGFSLRLTIPIESTKGPVTTVPLSAVSLAPDGKSRVQVETGGRLEYIQVEPGLAAGGFVEVKPVDSSLKPGQLVVVGFENVEGQSKGTGTEL